MRTNEILNRIRGWIPLAAFVSAAVLAGCYDDEEPTPCEEYCDAADDCSSTGDPCLPTESCNEVTDTCEPSSCLPRVEPCDPANDQCCNSCHPVKLTCK